MSLIVLNPVSLPPAPVENLGARLPDLAGKTVGFFNNNKPNADAVLARVADRLIARFGIAARHYNKGVPSLQAPEELLDEVATDCDAVVVAAYD